MALLAYLALEPGPHPRDRLAALLWGESSEEKARASLRQALKVLRPVLAEAILVERATVELQPAVECDVASFLAAAEHDPEAVVQQDVSRFFMGLAPKHCPEFEQWVDEVRSRALTRYHHALAACGQEAVARRQWRRGIELGELWLRSDPLSNQAAHLLIESLYLSGDTSGALARYTEFSERHEAALGAVPDFELRELVKRMGDGEPPPLPHVGNDDWHETTGHFESALIGRDREWNALTKAWRTLRHGEGGVVVVEGDVGAGKTRLADDFQRWATTQGAQTLRARPYESGSSVRFGTAFELLREAIDLPGAGGADANSLSVLSRIVPDIRRRFPAVPPVGSDPPTALLHQAAEDLLLAAAEDGPLLILVDDFHWCDPDSGAMLHHLVHQLARAPVLWYLSFTLGNAERDAAVIRVARALRALPNALRLRLAPLSQDEVLAMVRDLGQVPGNTGSFRFARSLHEVTDGNPFYLIELLKTLLAEGQLTVHPETGEWILPKRGEREVEVGAMPPTVQEAIAQRVARIPEQLRSILITIAAHHHGCHASVLSHVHGISRIRAAALGDDLEERYLVTEEDGRYQCAHTVIAKVVLGSLRPARRRELHRAIALAMITLARSGETPLDPAEVAFHAEQGGERGVAYEHALLAFKASQQLGDREEALGWLDVAASCAAGPEQTAAVDHATAALLKTSGEESQPSI